MPRGVKTESPIVVRTNIDKSGNVEIIRNLIVLEEESSASLIDEVSSSDVDNLSTNIVTEIFLAKGAKLNYVNLQTHGKQTIQHLFQRTRIFL